MYYLGLVLICMVVAGYEISTALAIDSVCRKRWGKWIVSGYALRWWEAQPPVQYVAIEMDRYRFYDSDMELILEALHPYEEYENILGMICHEHGWYQ